MSRSLRDAGVLIAAKLPVLFDIAVRWMGPLLVLLAWALFGAVTHVYFNDILPVMGLSPFALPGSLWTVLGLFLLFNLVYNHLGAVLVSPGFVPDSLPNPPNFDQIFKEELDRARRAVKGESFSTVCFVCRRIKPPRAHHCHVCNRCVLKMDHHCPWVANCVGFHNLKYFYRFLLYLFLACGFVLLSCAPLLFYKPDPMVLRAHHLALMFSIVLCASAFLALGMMLGLHTYLLLTNQSTIEMYFNRSQEQLARQHGEVWVNPFDMGWSKNMQQVFGVSNFWLRWMLPGACELGDGLSFPTRHGAVELPQLNGRAPPLVMAGEGANSDHMV